MIAFMESRVGRAIQWAAGAALLVLLALAIGRLVPTQPGFAIVIALVLLALGLSASEPAAIPLISMPMLLWGSRIGAGAIDLSVSDAVLFVATLAALVFTTRPFSPPLRAILWLSAIYQFATFFTVVANPHTANAVEWVHEWMLVSGALLVGWTVARTGHARLGMSLLLLFGASLGIATIIEGALQFASGDFGAIYPSWPFGMHKNFAGTLFGILAITAYVNPSWMGWRRGPALAVFWIMMAAVLFTQSRQSIIGLGVALFVALLRGDPHRKRSKLIVVVALPLLLVAGSLVQDQIQEGDRFNSVFQRLNWFEETMAYWAESPWVGHGLRFWYQPGPIGYHPPNVEIEVLASAGVVGLAGFLLMMVGALVVLWRMDPAFGTLAAVVVLSRFTHGQFDQFWVAGQVSVPFAIAGVCLGAQAYAAEQARLRASARIDRREALTG